MKTGYIFITMLGVTLLSCTREIDEEVSSCNFSEVTINSSQARASIYQELLDEYTKEGLPGISVAIETPDDGWWIGTAGMARIEEEIPLEPCHLHHSASQSKPYIATLIMRLREQGKLDILDPVRNYLPQELNDNIVNADVATISQLLNHTSGIFNFNSSLKMYVDTFNDPVVHKSVESILKKYVYGVPATNAAGEVFNYSNTGFALLGMIVEAASGMSLGDYFEQEIIEVVGLQNTYYKSSPGFPDIPNTVNSYFEHFPGQLQNCTDSQKNFAAVANGYEGIIASSYDYARFIRELMRGNILDSASLVLMTSQEYRSGDTKSVCLGLKEYYTDYGSAFGHTGGSMGAVGYMMHFPEANITFAMQSNISGVFESKNTDRFYEDLKDEFLKVIFTGSR